MLADLMNVVAQCTNSAVANNSSIPNEQKAAASQHIASSLVEGLQQHVGQQGGVLGLLNMFSSSSSSGSNPIAGSLQSTVVKLVSEKMNINPAMASSIVAAVLPMIMNSLGKKAADPQDQSLDFNSLFHAIGGAAHTGGADLNSLMQRVNDSSDNFGLEDIAKMVEGNAGGIGGILGSLFGTK